MGATTTAWGARVEELLADGRWHALEDVIAAAAKLVPPGRAYRKGEWNRARRGNAPAQRRLGTRETAVATGARIIAKKAVEDRLRNGTAERIGDRIRGRSR